MKIASLTKLVGLLIPLVMASATSFAGVTHPCSESQFDIKEYESIQSTSVNGQMIARIDLRQMTNRSCANLGPNERRVESKISLTETASGAPVPFFVKASLQTIDGWGQPIDRVDGVAQTSPTIRLRDGAVAVEIAIDGFDVTSVGL